MTATFTLDHLGHSVLEGGIEKPTLAPLNRKFLPGLLSVVGGPSGAGKTTLLSLLSLTIRAAHGMILSGEENLTALKPAAARCLSNPGKPDSLPSGTRRSWSQAREWQIERRS